MRMDAMIDCFIRRGFNVECTYDSRTDTYMFEIRKDGKHYSENFEYRPFDDEATEDSRQQNFINHMLEQFDLVNDVRSTWPTVNPYIKRDVETTEKLYEQMIMYRTMFNSNPFAIKDVIFNDPATIVFWADGTKTVVKCQDGDTYDAEKGLAMAITKKALGNKGNYCNVFHKWMNKYTVESLYPKLTDNPFVKMSNAIADLAKKVHAKSKDALVEKAYHSLTEDNDHDAAVGDLGEYLDD